MLRSGESIVLNPFVLPSLEDLVILDGMPSTCTGVELQPGVPDEINKFKINPSRDGLRRLNHGWVVVFLLLHLD